MINDSKNKKIVIKALCIIEQGRKLLLCKSYDNVKKEIFFRFVGGTVNFGEKSEEALRREIKEELNSEIENLKFIIVIENIFTYEGGKNMKFVFFTREIWRGKIFTIRMLFRFLITKDFQLNGSQFQIF